MRILAVSGSLRGGSYNTSLLRAAIEAAPEGVEVELWDGIGDLPIYDQDLESAEPPDSVRRLREDWAAADAILFSTPEYNGSLPGGLKNAVDWASRPIDGAALRNKNVAVIGASTGQFGAMWAQADLRKVLGVAGARVLGDELPVTRAPEKFDAEGRLLDTELSELLRLTLETLKDEGPLSRPPDPVTSVDLAEALPAPA
jgi:chromate reductase, NAD(P)H dehydrogenase (quinone)